MTVSDLIVLLLVLIGSAGTWFLARSMRTAAIRTDASKKYTEYKDLDTTHIDSITTIKQHIRDDVERTLDTLPGRTDAADMLKRARKEYYEEFGSGADDSYLDH